MDKAGKRISQDTTGVPTVPTTNAATSTVIGSIAGTVTGSNPGYSGNVIGRARVKVITMGEAGGPISSPDTVQNMFLFDIQMKQGKSLGEDVKAIS